MREQTLLSRRRVAAFLPVAAFSAPMLAGDDKADAGLLTLGSELEAVHAARAAFDKANPDADDDPFYERHWQLREAINRAPAKTLAGLAVKGKAAQMALCHDPSSECECEGAFRDLSSSLIDDLLKIVAKGGANA